MISYGITYCQLFNKQTHNYKNYVLFEVWTFLLREIDAYGESFTQVFPFHWFVAAMGDGVERTVCDAVQRSVELRLKLLSIVVIFLNVEYVYSLLKVRVRVKVPQQHNDVTFFINSPKWHKSKMKRICKVLMTAFMF